jgi:hypothetical protein
MVKRVVQRCVLAELTLMLPRKSVLSTSFMSWLSPYKEAHSREVHQIGSGGSLVVIPCMKPPYDSM